MKIFRRIPKTPEEKTVLRRDRKLLILSGLLIAAGFPPVPYPVTLFFALIPFFFVLERRQTLLELNRAVYLMGFTASLAGLYWVGAFTVGKDPYLMAGGILLFFVNAIPFMISTTVYYYTRKYFSAELAFWCFPFFWTAYEHIYTLTDWSFPWLNLGNGLSNFTLYIQAADIIGAPGLSLFVVYINLFLYAVAKKYMAARVLSMPLAAPAVLLFILPLLYGAWRLPISGEGAALRAGIVQPNLDPYDKWAGNNISSILLEYLSASRELSSRGADILLWPETALPVYLLSPGQTQVKDSVAAFVRESGVPLLTGMPDIRYYSKQEAKPRDVKYAKEADFYYATYNGIYLFEPGGGAVQRYGKMRLVPFGERVPFVDQIPVLGDLMRWGVGLSGWNVGEEQTVFSATAKNGSRLKIGGLVCYESIYGDMAAGLVRRGAELLVVVTNDSWYGNTSGPYQHRDYAKLRAVETRRYVIRAANGGISCVINPEGRVVSQTQMYEKAAYNCEFKPARAVTVYSRWPNAVPSMVMIITVWLFGISLMKKIARYDGKQKESSPE